MPDSITVQISGLSPADLPRLRQALPQGAQCVELPLEAGPSARRAREVFGRLVEIDMQAHTARLQSEDAGQSAGMPAGLLIPLSFAPAQSDDMLAALGKRMSALGLARLDAEDGIARLDVWRTRVQPDREPVRPLLQPLEWPNVEDRIDNVDVEAFLREIHGVDQGDE